MTVLVQSPQLRPNTSHFTSHRRQTFDRLLDMGVEVVVVNPEGECWRWRKFRTPLGSVSQLINGEEVLEFVNPHQRLIPSTNNLPHSD